MNLSERMQMLLSIIMQLYKQKKTNISIVGDPDQSIYRFRYGNSQIGEQAPQNGKQPLNEFVELCKKIVRIN